MILLLITINLKDGTKRVEGDYAVTVETAEKFLLALYGGTLETSFEQMTKDIIKTGVLNKQPSPATHSTAINTL